MHCLEPREPRFQGRGQRRVSLAHIGEQGVATGLRQLNGVEQGGGGRTRPERDIGVPVVAGPGAALGHAVFDLVGDPIERRLARQQIALHALLKPVGLAEQRPEAAREGNLLVRRQRLIANHQQPAMAEPSRPQFRKAGIVERRRQVYPSNRRTQIGPKFLEMPRHGRA
jgi:hypothetical protein